MNQDSNEAKPGSRNFYTYPGGNASEQAKEPEPVPEEKSVEAPGAAAPQASDAPAAEAFAAAETPNPAETADEVRKSRGKLLPGLLITVLLAAVLCGAGYLIEKFASAGSGSVASGSGVSGVDATLYLKSLAWEKKSHDTLKSLSKMKNLRYALQFFDAYSPEQISEADSMPSSISETMQDYKNQVGTLVSMQAYVEQKVPVTEELETDSSAPSILLSLSAPGASGDASMLVVGSTLDDIQTGDEISFRCIPLYCYAPKNTEGGLFLITAPELVQKYQAH